MTIDLPWPYFLREGEGLEAAALTKAMEKGGKDADAARYRFNLIRNNCFQRRAAYQKRRGKPARPYRRQA